MSYRTSVFNDFTVVSKAVFYGMKRNTYNPNNFDLEKILPVQINPNNLTELTSGRVSRPNALLGAIQSSNAYYAPPRKCNELKSLTVRLVYDIYDEYNVRTCDGVTGLTQDISLNNKDLTSLPTLIEYSHDNSIFTLFRWGSVNFFGTIVSVDCSYDAFSCWGQPLKCEATVSMKEIPVEKAYETDNILNCFGAKFKTKVKLYEGMLKTLKVGSQLIGAVSPEMQVVSSAANRNF